MGRLIGQYSSFVSALDINSQQETKQFPENLPSSSLYIKYFKYFNQNLLLNINI